ncbi:MAG: hypothetical protein IT319_11825 [Anaerolineae bacterium]|nr:hypothetical protein [Anaerolineae bacterium]
MQLLVASLRHSDRYRQREGLRRMAAEADLADVVAYLRTKDTASAELATAANLYARNCAACHG